MEKRKKRLLFGTAVLAAAALAAGIAYAGSRGQQVATAVAVAGAVEDYYTEEGTISSGKEYQVIARVSGPIDEILVRENSPVQKGDLLFTIDGSDYEYQKSLAESTLAGYEAKLEETRINQVMTASPQEYLDGVKQDLSACEAKYQSAKTIYEGSQTLYEQGAISKVEQEEREAAYKAAMTQWQEARSRYEESCRFLESLKEEGIDQNTINTRFYNSETNQLTAQIQSQKTLVSQLQDQLDRCQARAEFDGIVTSLPVEKLSVIQTGETAAVLNGRNGLEAEADVLTNIAPYIQEGSPVEVVLQLRGKDEVYQGTVSQIYDYADKGTSSLGLDEYRVHVKVALEDQEGLKGKEGYGVSLKFLLYNREDGLTVPSSAVFETDDQYYVYEIQKGHAVKVPVEIEYQTATRTVIASGLEEGEIVIDQVDSEGIYEGAKVRK